MSDLELTCDQGVDFNLSTYVTTETGEYENLTGATAHFEVNKGYEDRTVVYADTEEGSITLGGTYGTIDIVIEADDTDAFDSPSRYPYSLSITLVSGKEIRILKGEFVVEPGI